MTPTELREEIETLEHSSDGDERIIGKGLQFYAKAAGDAELVEIITDALENFIGISQALLNRL